MSVVLNEAFDEDGAIVYREACWLGEGIVSKRLVSPYRAGQSARWVKVKNPQAPAVKREAEESRQMLAPPEREPSYPKPSPLRRSLLEFVLWFGTIGAGLCLYLWAFSHWLWLAVHHGLHSLA